MKRLFPFAVLLLLGACASHNDATGLRDGQPGVDVADAALRGGSPQIALQIDNGLLAKDPHNVPALLNRGDVLTAQQLYDEAASSYAAALAADPKSIQARIGLGRLRLRNDPAAAERLFLEVTQRDANNAVALNDLGIARDLLGNHQEAQQAYRQAMGLDPQMVGARVNLALSLAMTGRADDATPMMRAVADAPSAPRKYRHDMAAVLAMGGDRAGAEQILSRDMTPEQANQAVAIFTAASLPAGSPIVPQPARAGASAPQADVASGGIMVRLATGHSSAAVESHWRHLRQHLPSLLADRQPTLSKVGQTGAASWQLLTGAFGTLSEAASFCSHIKASGASCAIAGS